MIRIIKRLLKLAGRDALKIKLGFLFGFLESTLSAPPLIAVFLVLRETGRAGQGSDMIRLSVIGQCLFLLITDVTGRAVFRYLLSRYQSGTGYEIFAKQRLLIGDMLKRVPMGYSNDNHLGEITSTVATGTTFTEVYSMHLLDKVVNRYIAVVLYSLVVPRSDWRTGLTFILAILISAFPYWYLQKWGKELVPERQIAQVGPASAVLEYIQGMAAIKAFHMTRTGSKRVHETFEESRLANLKMEKTLIPIVATYDFMSKTVSYMIPVATPYFVLGGSMTYSAMFLLLIASFTIFSSIENMGNVTIQIRMMNASLDRTEAIKDVAVIDEDGRDVDLDRYDIELNHASFPYGQREMVYDVSFTIPQGTMTVTVGPSGSGKTTLCNLIVRFWDVQRGEVLVGGVNTREMACDSLLCNIGMVPQKVYLSNGTIYNNIRSGRQDASREQVEKAAKRACCHGFITKLPQGYDTVIGEGGSSLSRGEKQRTLIARATLKDVPIVILDETTASTDPENERDTQLAIEELIQGKTRIAIAHRLTTIRNAGQILVVDGERVIQQGPHDKLITKPGIYRHFWITRQKSSGWML